MIIMMKRSVRFTLMHGETCEDDEEGIVIATVNYKTKEIEYLDEDARTDEYAQEVIEETLQNIDDGDFNFKEEN